MKVNDRVRLSRHDTAWMAAHMGVSPEQVAAMTQVVAAIDAHGRASVVVDGVTSVRVPLGSLTKIQTPAGG